MAVFAIVPVKRLGISKRRLSAVLSPQERKLLTVAMLEDVLTALKASLVQETVVVSNDSAIRELAEKYGVSHIVANRKGLNLSVEEATEWCVQNHADSVLVLPADLPLLLSKDIDRIVELGQNETSVVLCPSQNGGTNALFKNPPNVISACFGPKSFAKHFREAYEAGVKAKLYYSSGIGTDIDSVEDLKKLLEARGITKSGHFLGSATIFKKPEQLTAKTARRRPDLARLRNGRF